MRFRSGCACLLYTSYTPETLTPTVSSPTIGKDGTLRVGVGGGAPFIVASSDATSSGLDLDVAAAIAGQLGLKLEVVSLGSSASAVSYTHLFAPLHDEEINDP